MDTQPSNTPTSATPPAAAPAISGSGRSKVATWLPRLVVGLVVLLLVAAAAYAGYYWERQSAMTTENSLRSQINTLKQTGSGPSARTTINSNKPACSETDLSVAQAATASAAGTTGITYSFANTSLHDCTLTASPVVTLLDASGKQLGQPAEATKVSDITITLQSTEKAYATVLFPNAANFSAGTCSADQAAKLEFLPSSNSGALFADVSGQHYCPGLAIQPFTTTAP